MEWFIPAWLRELSFPRCIFLGFCHMFCFCRLGCFLFLYLAAYLKLFDY